MTPGRGAEGRAQRESIAGEKPYCFSGPDPKQSLNGSIFMSYYRVSGEADLTAAEQWFRELTRTNAYVYLAK